MEILNINSSYNIRMETIHRVLSHAGPLFNPGRTPSIYMVDNELMDLIAPPEISVFLDAARIKALLTRFNQEFALAQAAGTEDEEYTSSWFNNPEEAASRAESFWTSAGACTGGSVLQSFRGSYAQRLGLREVDEIRRRVRIRVPFSPFLGEGRESEAVSIARVPSLGDMHLYLKTYGKLGAVTGDPTHGKLKWIIEQHEDAVPRENAVFICMDRIVATAQKMKNTWCMRQIDLNTIVETLFSAYLARQLAYAQMVDGSGKEPSMWGRVIEEAIIVAYCLTCLEDGAPREILKAHIIRQPLEYRGYPALEGLNQVDLVKLLKAWSTNNFRRVLELNIFWDLSNLPLADYEKSMFGFRSIFAGHPDRLWQIMALEIMRRILKEVPNGNK